MSSFTPPWLAASAKSAGLNTTHPRVYKGVVLSRGDGAPHDLGRHAPLARGHCRLVPTHPKAVVHRAGQPAMDALGASGVPVCVPLGLGPDTTTKESAHASFGTRADSSRGGSGLQHLVHDGSSVGGRGVHLADQRSSQTAPNGFGGRRPHGTGGYGGQREGSDALGSKRKKKGAQPHPIRNASKRATAMGPHAPPHLS